MAREEDSALPDEQTTLVRDDDTVVLKREEVEPRRRRPLQDPGPWLLLLLILVLGGLAAFWVFSRTDTKEVPDLVGLPLDEAVSRLEADGFHTDLSEQASERPRGTVAEQDPAAGTEADDGSTVQVVVSSGPARVAVPDVVGREAEAAEEELTSAGFEVRTVEVFSDQPEGIVIAQNPEGSEQAEGGSTVRINVSKGPGEATLPSLVGKTREDAQAELEQLALKSNAVEVPSAEPAGTVVAQNPVAGTTVRVGSLVRLNVSTGSPTTTETTETTTTP